MKITESDVRHVALLSRLELGEEEVKRYAGELSKLFDYIEKLRELSTDDVEPTSHPLKMTNVLRPDVVKPSLSPEEATANAPEREDDCFKVPQII